MIRNLVMLQLPIYYYCIILAYMLVFHCIIAVVFNKVATADKIKYPFFAWIPILNMYLIVKMGKTNRWLLLTAVGLIIPELWIFFLVAFMFIIANFIADTLKRYGVGTLLIYCGIIVPFLWVIPLIEVYGKAQFNIRNNYTFGENNSIIKLSDNK